MFEYFKQAKRHEIKALRKLESLNKMPLVFRGQRVPFSQNLYDMALIAEYKRASPSRGLINLKFSAAEVAGFYKKGGAAAISVLTEKSKFKGHMKYIDEVCDGSNLPVLRKDFIFHPLQVMASASTKASAILLIVKMTPEISLLSNLIKQAAGYGLEAVVEVFDEADLGIAREAGAKLIQVNARDFSDLSVDLQRPLRLAEQQRHKGSREIWIAASGFSQAQQISAAQNAGFDAALVGTSLMASADPATALSLLKSGY